LFVAAADPVLHRFGEAVGFRPDDFGAQDEAEVVDAAQRVAPWDAHQRLGADAVGVDWTGYLAVDAFLVLAPTSAVVQR
jgi:hypothetical protein